MSFISFEGIPDSGEMLAPIEGREADTEFPLCHLCRSAGCWHWFPNSSLSMLEVCGPLGSRDTAALFSDDQGPFRGRSQEGAHSAVLTPGRYYDTPTTSCSLSAWVVSPS